MSFFLDNFIHFLWGGHVMHDYPPQRLLLGKNEWRIKRAVGNGKREKALSPSHRPPRAFFSPAPQPPYDAKRPPNKIKSHEKRGYPFIFSFFFSPLEEDDNFSSLFRSISRLFWTLCNSNRRWFANIQAYTSKWICRVRSRLVITLGLHSSECTSRSPTWNCHNQFPGCTTSSKRRLFSGRITWL